MGLFSKRKQKARRKAEEKALRHKAAVEAKLGAKRERKRLRADLKSQKKSDRAQQQLSKAQVATLKAQEQASLKQAERASREVLSVASVKKYLGVARVLTPVLAPLVYRGATVVREQLENRKAQRLGVEVEQLGEFTGSGAKLNARIANAESSLAEIVSRGSDKDETQKFADATRGRLTDLTTAVQAAEQMPLPRRRAAHQAISTELSGIEADLLARLGVH